MIKKFIQSLEKCLSYCKFGIYLYVKPYQKIIKNEIKLAAIKASDTVYQIGCGAIPFTAIWIARLTGAKVICIDTDKDAVKRARRVVKKLKLEPLITVQVFDGSHPINEDYSVCLIALQAAPLDEIVEAINFNQARVVVARLPKKSYAKHYDVLPDTVKIGDKVDQSMKAFDQSVIIFKR